MSSSRRRPELRLSISQGRDGSQYHRGGTPEKSPSSGKYFLLTSPFIEPHKAIGLESPIEPWLALLRANPAACHPAGSVGITGTELCQVQGVGPNYGSQYHKGGTALNITGAGRQRNPRRRGSIFS